MMRKFIQAAAYTLSTCGLLFGMGCNQDVSHEDVMAARKEVAEEQFETQETREEARQELQKEENETDELRREVLKPNLDELRDKEREAEEVRKEGEEKIREEERETQEAEKNARQVEAKFEAQQSRDAYVKQVKLKLEEAEQRIEQLKTDASNQEGVVKKETESKIQAIQTQHDHVEDALDGIMSVDALKWKDRKDGVDGEMKDLEAALNNSI